MRDIGKLDPTLRLLGHKLSLTLKLEADLKEITETLRRLDKSEDGIKEIISLPIQRRQHANR